jgi:excisionase family DNA binding protein
VTDRIVLDPDEAAAALGVSVRTLRDWTAAGWVPSIKRGSIRLYSVDALRDWARQASRYGEGESDAEAQRPAAVPAGGRPLARRSPGRAGKPRSPRQALPVRLLEGGSGGEAG